MPPQTPRTPRTPGKPIRRIPMHKRIVTPLDLSMWCGEVLNDVNWEDHFCKFSYALAASLNLLYLRVRYGQDARVEEEPWALEFDTVQHPSESWKNTLEGLIWVICLMNTFYMFWRSKKILLFKQPTEPNLHIANDQSWLLKSPNAKIVSVDMTGAVHDGVDSEISVPTGKRLSFTTKVKSLFAKWRRPSRPVPKETPTRRVWQLTIWDPSPGSINLFCWFSPVQLLIMYNISRETLGYQVPLSFLSGLMIHWLVRAFQELCRDREILSGQLIREYEHDLFRRKEFFPPRRFDFGGKDSEGRTILLFPQSVKTETHYEEEVQYEQWEDVEQRLQETYIQQNVEEWRTDTYQETWPDPNELVVEEEKPALAPRSDLNQRQVPQRSTVTAMRERFERNDENRSPAERRSPEKSYENVFQRR